MALRISSLVPSALSELQLLWNEQLTPYPYTTLADSVQDAARNYGENVVLAWRNEKPVGCAGWVTLGIAKDCCAYGAPFIAADIEVATTLIEIVREKVQAAGARRLRITTRVGEDAKLYGLRQAGFKSIFEFANLARPLPLAAPADLPKGLHRINPDAIDWTKLHQCYADTFSDVPNSPVPDETSMREEWAAADMQASLIVADDNGEYQGFVMVIDATVDAVGVREQWRGKGLAAILYHQSAVELTAQDATEMRALVATSNSASIRLHQKLGFTEAAPRSVVHELSW